MVRTNRLLTLMALVAFAAGIALSIAQEPKGPPPGQPPGPQRGMMGPMIFGGIGGFGGFGGSGGGASGATLLWNEAIQKELELVDDQKTQLRTAKEEARQEMMRIYNEQLRKKLREILLPSQWERLQQIQLQQRGAGAMEDETVVQELKITEAQKEKLRKIREKVEATRKTAMSGAGAVNWRELGEEERQKLIEQMRAKWEEVRKTVQEAGQEALEVLTPEQREAFEKLKGAKFEWPQPQGRAPGGEAIRVGRPDR